MKESEGRAAVEPQGLAYTAVGSNSKRFLDHLLKLSEIYQDAGLCSTHPRCPPSCADPTADAGQNHQQDDAAEAPNEPTDDALSAKEPKHATRSDTDSNSTLSVGPASRATSTNSSQNVITYSLSTSDDESAHEYRSYAIVSEKFETLSKAPQETRAHTMHLQMPRRIVHLEAITELGMRLVRKSKRCYYLVSTGDVSVSTDAGAVEIVERVVELSKEWFEKGEPASRRVCQMQDYH